MGNSNNMRPPYYILINDKDPERIRFYHEYHFGNCQYENEFGDDRPETAAYIKTYHSRIHLGPRRMRYIETALKFRAKIAKIKELPEPDLKVVRVEKSQKATVNKIMAGSLEPVPFEGIYK